MAKSDPSAQSRINLDDTPKEIMTKIKRATVDSIRGVTYDPVNRPGVANLLRIHAALRAVKEPGCVEATPEGCAEVFSGYDNARLKEVVGEGIVDGLGEVRDRMVRFKKDKAYVEEVLRKGEEKAIVAAERTMRDVKRAVGFC
ncbi:Tryptophan--tRNA ligase, mitochondrial [Chytriomyces hyalinus]|nr:Tryptophan--tRNA ligase, mitochondrial [Chytriomyces hyalinus]